MHLSHLLAKSWNAGLEPVNYLVTNVVQSSTIYSPNFLQDTILSSAQHSLLRKPFLVLQDTSHEIFFHWHFQFGFSQGKYLLGTYCDVAESEKKLNTRLVLLISPLISPSLSLSAPSFSIILHLSITSYFCNTY